MWNVRRIGGPQHRRSRGAAATLAATLALAASCCMPCVPRVGTCAHDVDYSRDLDLAQRNCVLGEAFGAGHRLASVSWLDRGSCRFRGQQGTQYPWRRRHEERKQHHDPEGKQSGAQVQTHTPIEANTVPLVQLGCLRMLELILARGVAPFEHAPWTVTCAPFGCALWLDHHVWASGRDRRRVARRARQGPLF